jgi:phosphomannomutase
VVDKVVEYCKEKGYDINTIDGVRATFNDGWALVRCSNTGPNITVRFEAETQERLEEIQKEFLSKIEEYNHYLTYIGLAIGGICIIFIIWNLVKPKQSSSK